VKNEKKSCRSNFFSKFNEV